MSEAKPEERFGRIMVACDPTPPGSAALEAAVVLAASLQAELAGLFVEDINLLRLAALPFTRELGLASAVMRPIDVPDVEREFRLHADRVRKALEDAAAARSLRWSFQVIRGEPLAVALSARGDADLLVLGGTAQSAARGARAILPPHPAASATARRAEHGVRVRPVAVVYDGSSKAGRALNAAAALAALAECPLHVWVAADHNEEFRQLREGARALLAGHEGATRILWLRRGDLETVGHAIGADSPAALLWHDPLDSRQLAALLAAVRCPLVLLR